MKKIYCEHCGSNDLIPEGEYYICNSCGTKWEKNSLDEVYSRLSAMLDDVKQEQLANLRHLLYDAIIAEYTDSVNIIRLCREIRKFDPEDFMACTYEVLSGGNVKEIKKAIDGIDADKYIGYVPTIIDFLIKSLTSEILLEVNNLIERAYKANDLVTYDTYTTKLAEEAKKIDDCVYDVTMPRDVFVAYSSADMDKVEELVDALEEEGLSCFVAMRNMQHGRDAVGNYDANLQEAMDNCRAVVLVSSVRSRTASDARKKELPYIRKRDIEKAPPQYSNDYKKLPHIYKKPRVEFLIEPYKGMASEGYVKEFFDGYEFRYSPREVAEELFKQFDAAIGLEEENLKKAEEAARKAKEESERNAKVNEELEKQREMLEKISNAQTATSSSANVETLMLRARQFAENGDSENARSYYNRVLDISPENGEAWWGMFLADNDVADEKQLFSDISEQNYTAYKNDSNYRSAVKYAAEELRQRIKAFEANCLSEIRRKAQEEAARKMAEFKTEADVNGNKLVRYKGTKSQVVVPEGITVIGNDAFKNCTSLTSVVLPSGLTAIGDNAFLFCRALTEVTLPNSLVSIGDCAFLDCELKSITIPSSVTKIGTCAFGSTRLLRDIEVESGNKAYYSKYDCLVDRATNRLLLGCKNSKIPDGVTVIDGNAFGYCPGLTSITIPSSVTTIENAFQYCDNLQTVYYQGTKKQWKQISIGKLNKGLKRARIIFEKK